MAPFVAKADAVSMQLEDFFATNVKAEVEHIKAATAISQLVIRGLHVLRKLSEARVELKESQADFTPNVAPQLPDRQGSEHDRMQESEM